MSRGVKRKDLKSEQRPCLKCGEMTEWRRYSRKVKGEEKYQWRCSQCTRVSVILSKATQGHQMTAPKSLEAAFRARGIPILSPESDENPQKAS